MASSPASSTGDDPKKGDRDITFRFCRECSNMLYPKEDPDNRQLQFACRTCQYSEKAEGTCVYRNYLSNTAGETAGVTQDVGSDPTVGLPLCLLCGGVIACDQATVSYSESASPQIPVWRGAVPKRRTRRSAVS